MKATAVAHPNIALVKYWGKRDEALILPHQSILSMTLDGLSALLTVHGDPGDPLAGSCVHAQEHGYGTRSGFVFIGGARPAARWFEGHPCEARQSELGPSLRELGIA